MKSWPVVVASTLQFLLAAAFLVQAALAYRHGAAAQRAAEAEVEAQGFPAHVLARHHVSFKESSLELLLPLAIALGLAALAWLNLQGSGLGRTLSFVFQPIVLVGGGIVTAGQVFAVRHIQSSLQKAEDPTVRGIDVQAFVDAALAAFPSWFRYLVTARFLLATAGSLLVIILLATPSARAHFG